MIPAPLFHLGVSACRLVKLLNLLAFRLRHLHHFATLRDTCNSED